MKKTLIAFAALAVVGAASAQTTLSGKLSFGYDKAQGGVAGLAVMDGNWTVTATEDLGGGLKATAKAEFVARGRDTSMSGRDASITLSGGFGSLMIGAVEGGNGIIGRGFAGAPVSLRTGYDGAILSGASNIDMLMYSTPSMGGFGLSISRIDSIGGAGTGKGATQANGLGVSYAAGPLSAGFDYTAFAGGLTHTRNRLSASYDAGAAVIGLGYEKSSNAVAQNAFGVKVPLSSAASVGLIYAKNGASKGWGAGMDYNLSKTTVLNVSMGDETSIADGSQYRIRLLKSF